MGDVIYINRPTLLDIDPDRVVSAANGKLDQAIVIGYDKDGNEYFASSIADAGAILWLLERMKMMLLKNVD